jgi:integrase
MAIIAGGDAAPVFQPAEHAFDDAAAVAIYPGSMPATRNRQFYTPLSAVMKHVGIETKVRRPKGAAGAARTSWLLPEQFELLAAAAVKDDPEFSLLTILLYYTGLRLNEALRLCCADVDLEQATALCGRTKNGTARGVHLPPRILAALANLPPGLDRRGRIFRWMKCGELYQFAEWINARAR